MVHAVRCVRPVACCILCGTSLAGAAAALQLAALKRLVSLTAEEEARVEELLAMPDAAAADDDDECGHGPNAFALDAESAERMAEIDAQLEQMCGPPATDGMRRKTDRKGLKAEYAYAALLPQRRCTSVRGGR